LGSSDGGGRCMVVGCVMTAGFFAGFPVEGAMETSA